jgi:beta-glucosidase
MREKYYLIIILLLLIHWSCAVTPDYKNSKNPVDIRVENLISLMTLEEKIHQLSGDGKSSFSNERLGIPSIIFNDGPFGAHNFGKISAFGSGITMASTWDVDLIGQVSRAMALEALAYNVDCLLGPCINIHRNPLGGRNFESFGEDPWLASRIAVSYIDNLQRAGVMANSKHYALNNQEWQRHFYDAIVDERSLMEIYLPAFEATVKEAQVASFMSSYNKINGTYAAENKYLLTEILKERWGFKGFVVPDWAGAHSSIGSAMAGLDLIVYDSHLFKDALLEAVKNGEVSEDVIDDKLRRIYGEMFRFGLFDKRLKADQSVLNSAEHNMLARKLAADGTVLLKNKNDLLPLNGKYKTIAVIGPNAAELVHGGGGSSHIPKYFYKVSPLEGITRAAGQRGINVVFEEGVAREHDLQPIEPRYLKPSNTSQGTMGLWGEYFDNMHLEGSPVIERLDSTIFFRWGKSPHFLTVSNDDAETKTMADNIMPDDFFSIRWTGKLLPPKTGYYSLKVASDDGVRLYLDGELIIDNWWRHDVERRFVWLELKAGKEYDIKIEYFEAIGAANMYLGWQYHDPALITKAARVAQQADIAIIVAGTNELFESEEYDRTTLDLPWVQQKLINEVSKANPNTVVVLQSGGSLNLQNWSEKVPAILNMWFPGHEGGNALADVLFGDVNPSGKLCFTWINQLKDYPPVYNDHQSEDQKVRFSEGVFVGYRYHDKHKTNIAYPFGYGLSYTRFTLSDPIVIQNGKHNVQVDISVTNTGSTAGSEVVQLYVRDVQAGNLRPEKELKAFEKIFLQPGETKTITMPLDYRSFAWYNMHIKDWVIDADQFELLIGNSSRDIAHKVLVNF